MLVREILLEFVGELLNHGSPSTKEGGKGVQEAVFYIVVLIVCYSVFTDKTVALFGCIRRQKERVAAPQKPRHSTRRRRG